MLRSAPVSAQKGDPRPSTVWARGEAWTGLPAQALVELVLRFGMDRIEFSRLIERFPLRRGRVASRSDRRGVARFADVGENRPYGRASGKTMMMCLSAPR